MRLRTENLNWQRVDEEIVVLDLEGSSYLRLNATAALLWEAVAEGADRPGLVRALAEGYGIGEEPAAHDVDAFLDDLEDKGLLDRS